MLPKQSNEFVNSKVRFVFLLMAILTGWSVNLAESTGQELSESDAGYIDSAQLQDQFRVRYDSAFNNPFPDRAEFFYPKCGCFTNGTPGLGPPSPESRVDHQELEITVEKRMGYSLSGFIEVPLRFINPEVNENHAGLGDIRTGFKLALIQNPEQQVTFQLRSYLPTGDGEAGLGTEHISIEPALLFQRNRDRFRTFGEFRAWVPIDASEEIFENSLRNSSGTVLRYGLGASYDLFRRDCCRVQFSDRACRSRNENMRVSIVPELVGWTILDGLKFRTSNPAFPADPAFQIFASAAGDTIVNAKLGLRFTSPGRSVYLGYGTALTSEVWYKDIVRAEYSVRF